MICSLEDELSEALELALVHVMYNGILEAFPIVTVSVVVYMEFVMYLLVMKDTAKLPHPTDEYIGIPPGAPEIASGVVIPLRVGKFRSLCFFYTCDSKVVR